MSVPRTSLPAMGNNQPGNPLTNPLTASIPSRSQLRSKRAEEENKESFEIVEEEENVLEEMLSWSEQKFADSERITEKFVEILEEESPLLSGDSKKEKSHQSKNTNNVKDNSEISSTSELSFVENTKKSNNLLPWIVASVAVLIAVVLGVFMIMNSSNDNSALNDAGNEISSSDLLTNDEDSDDLTEDVLSDVDAAPEIPETSVSTFDGTLQASGFVNTLWINAGNTRQGFIFYDNGIAQSVFINNATSYDLEHFNNVRFSWESDGSNITISGHELLAEQLPFPLNSSIFYMSMQDFTRIGNTLLVRYRPTNFSATSRLEGAWVRSSSGRFVTPDRASIYFNADGTGQILRDFLNYENFQMDSGDFIWWETGDNLFIFNNDLNLLWSRWETDHAFNEHTGNWDWRLTLNPVDMESGETSSNFYLRRRAYSIAEFEQWMSENAVEN